MIIIIAVAQILQCVYLITFNILIFDETRRFNDTIAYCMVIEEYYYEYILIFLAELLAFILAYEFFIVIMIMRRESKKIVPEF